MLEQLFFELIRVSVGTQDCLTRTPMTDEWDQLYKMAEKQSLIGVCFVGLQRLGANADDGFAQIGMSEMQFLTWMGMTAKIQQNNEYVNLKCVELQKKLSSDGIESSILKGQGVAQSYAPDLRMLRQSGDIDVYVECGMEKAVAYVQRIVPTNEVNHKHVQMHVFKDCEVEIHFIPSELHCPWQNKHLQNFFACHDGKEKISLAEAGEIMIPELSFYVVHLLAHSYRHLFGDGIGLRQVMDLYFVFLKLQNVAESVNMEEIKQVVHRTGMDKFASAIMWVLDKVFNLNMDVMPWKPSARDGQFLLGEIMMAGNFGKYDARINRKGETRGGRFWRVSKQNWRLMRFSPWEVICTPLWRIWHFCWMRSHGYTQG